ncbi:hypothetical protein KDA_75210 [Dictyobacter alpinus]|uniref:Uncharacterized protein n=1 Tax=Dictyobacter alpinus TaxID=2014873 RepID=A0A402BKZ7_9CHLR|nr:hypothetical protein KDA_75210 [Dictyobacter alpinus]
MEAAHPPAEGCPLCKGSGGAATPPSWDDPPTQEVEQERPAAVEALPLLQMGLEA